MKMWDAKNGSVIVACDTGYTFFDRTRKQVFDMPFDCKMWDSWSDLLGLYNICYSKHKFLDVRPLNLNKGQFTLG